MNKLSFLGFALILCSSLSCARAQNPAQAPQAPVTAGAQPLTLWYQQPAKDALNEGLPIGNGQLGALVMGGVENERLAFNEDSLWTGGSNPSGGYDLREFGAYQAFGDLLISLDGAADAPQISNAGGQKSFYETESIAAATDGNPQTKWAVEHGGRNVVWQIALPRPRAVAAYTLTSAGDVPARDPQSWVLEGSDDGQNWTALDRHQNKAPFAERGQTKNYGFTNATAYRFYRITFEPNRAVPHFQVAEIALSGVELGERADNRAQNYRRELDLGDALARATFTRNGVTHTREVFASHPAQVIALRWSASQNGAVSGLIRLKGTHGETSSAQGRTLAFGGTLNNGLRYAARAQVVTRGGQAEVNGDGVQLRNCDEATILLTAATDYAMDSDKGYRGALPDLQARLDAAAKQGYQALKTAHLKDYGAIYNRVSAQLGTSSAAQRALPTDQRKLQAFQTVDPELEATLFQYGRYLMIASSRRPGLPANLQGLWNVSNDPPWYSDYHANINVQMNYWPVEVANMGETALPFFDLVQSQLPDWRRATQSSDHWKTPSGALATRGWALRTSHNTMGGLGWEWDETANAWYALHFWEHYAFSGDKTFLRETAYPILEETTRFWEDHLKTLPDGRLVVPNGWSPEHGPREDGVSYNQQIVWELFSNYVEAARVLGVDKDYAARVAAMRDKLVGPQIGKWGQLQEWMTDRDDPNDHHRHTSNLFGVFPGRQFSVSQTPELAKAAKVSLDARGIDAGSDVREWSFAWRSALYARLHDGENAHLMVQNLLAARNTCPNLFGLHPPMQVDGNFGISAGIAEMLLQSHGDAIELLPALPAAWPNGAVTGLRARGGFTVDISWRDGQLQRAKILSSHGATSPVSYGGKTVQLQFKAGQNAVLDGKLRASR